MDRAGRSSLAFRVMPSTVELPRVSGPGSGLGGDWRVIVRNDDHNTFDHVAPSLARYVPGVTSSRATRSPTASTTAARRWSGR